MTRYIVKGNIGDEEVIGEQFKIAGSGEMFIVHRSIGMEANGRYTATHHDTGFLIGWGDTIDDAIVHGTERWLECPREKLKELIENARKKAAARDCVRLEAGAA